MIVFHRSDLEPIPQLFCFNLSASYTEYLSFFLFFFYSIIANVFTIFRKIRKTPWFFQCYSKMLMEDKADLVREAVIKSLGIIMGYIIEQISAGMPFRINPICSIIKFRMV